MVFFGTRLLESLNPRKRKRRKNAGTESVDNENARIALPEIPNLVRVPMVMSPQASIGRISLPRFSIPIPIPPQIDPTQVHGSVVYPSTCGPYSSGIIPRFGLIEGPEVLPTMPSPPVPTPMVFGTFISPSVCDPQDEKIALPFSVGTLIPPSVCGPYEPPPYVSDVYVTTDTIHHIDISAQVPNLDPDITEYQVSLFRNPERTLPIVDPLLDTELRVRVASHDPPILEVDTEEIASLMEDKRVFARLRGIPATQGVYVAPMHCDVYPTARPPVFGPQPGTIVDPIDCKVSLDPTDITMVYGGHVNPSLCGPYDPNGPAMIFGSDVDPSLCGPYDPLPRI